MLNLRSIDFLCFLTLTGIVIIQVDLSRHISKLKSNHNHQIKESDLLLFNFSQGLCTSNLTLLLITCFMVPFIWCHIYTFQSFVFIRQNQTFWVPTNKVTRDGDTLLMITIVNGISFESGPRSSATFHPAPSTTSDTTTTAAYPTSAAPITTRTSTSSSSNGRTQFDLSFFNKFKFLPIL